MSNKEKIAELENLISTGLDLIGVLNSKVNLADIEVDKLKKEDEVKPVFPDYVHSETTYVMVANNDLGGSTAKDLGLTAYNEEGRLKIYEWLKARKFVIEAINRANGGDNGFKPDEENYCLLYSHSEQRTLDYINIDNQTQDNEFYFRDLTVMLKLGMCPNFITAFKTMRGIK